MLKITKDVTIRHDGREIHCTVGQIVNVRASFDINEDVAKGTEIRYADKMRTHCHRVNPVAGSNVVVLKPLPIHNPVEQKNRKASEEIAEIKDDVPEDKPEDLPNDVLDEKKEESKGEQVDVPAKKGGSRKKK